jgi:membrane fusion protein, multidrug efflux system
MTDTVPAITTAKSPGEARYQRWLYPSLRILFLISAIFLAWEIAGNWNKWTGAARFQRTDDANIVGDVTPLAAKVSGYVAVVGVNDYQAIRKGDLIVEIEPSDYQAQLAVSEAALRAAQAALANLANQKEVQRAVIDQAVATIAATKADLQRYVLEARRQHELLEKSAAGTQQVELADANLNRTQAQVELNEAQLAQQKATLASLDVQEQQLTAQVHSAEAQVTLAKNNVGYTRIISPVDGLVGQRLVRPGQFVNVGTQVIAVVPLQNVWAVANFKETQMTNVRIGDPVRVTVDAFPDLLLQGRVDSWSPGTGSTFALLPPDNATGNFTKVVQRVPVKIVLDSNLALGTLVRPGMSVVATIETSADPATDPTRSSTVKSRSSSSSPTQAGGN